MAAPLASKITLPDDSGNVGKKVRTQTRVVGVDTVHEHFFIPISSRKITGIYNFNVGTAYLVTVGAQTGTSTAIAWLVNPANTSAEKSMHIIDDGCITSIVWSTFFETAALAWNACWFDMDSIRGVFSAEQSQRHLHAGASP